VDIGVNSATLELKLTVIRGLLVGITAGVDMDMGIDGDADTGGLSSFVDDAFDLQRRLLGNSGFSTGFWEGHMSCALVSFRPSPLFEVPLLGVAVGVIRSLLEPLDGKGGGFPR